MNKERLELMVSLLDEVAEDSKLKPHFNLMTWVNVNRNQVLEDKLSVHLCGTTACAIGFAGLDPRFNELGFRLSPSGHTFKPVYCTADLHVTGWSAVDKFFDLNPRESSYLFSLMEYSNDDVSPRQVANRIRQVLKDQETIL